MRWRRYWLVRAYWHPSPVEPAHSWRCVEKKVHSREERDRLVRICRSDKRVHKWDVRSDVELTGTEPQDCPECGTPYLELGMSRIDRNAECHSPACKIHNIYRCPNKTCRLEHAEPAACPHAAAFNDAHVRSAPAGSGESFI